MHQCPPQWIQIFEPRSPPRPTLLTKLATTVRNSSDSSTLKKAENPLSSNGNQKGLIEEESAKQTLNAALPSRLQKSHSPLHSQASSTLHFSRHQSDRQNGTAKTKGHCKEVSEAHSTDEPGGNIPAAQTQLSKCPDDMFESSTPHFSCSGSCDRDSTNTERHPSNGTESFSKKEILSPRAIPASLVTPPKAWNIAVLRTRGREIVGTHEQQLQPRRSIADKLGSMVDRGWKGCDAWGRAYKDHGSSEKTSPTFHLRDRRMNYRSQSLGDEPQYTKKLVDDESLPRSVPKTQTKSIDSTEDGGSTFDNDEPRPFIYYDPRKGRQQRSKHVNTTDTSVQRSSLDAEQEISDESAASNHPRKRRAWTFHYSDRSECDQSQRLKLHTFSSHQNLECRSVGQARKEAHRSLSHGNTKSIPKPERETAGNEQDRHHSVATSLASGSRKSSGNTNQASHLASRSTSFFTKWRWWKLVLVDKQPVVQDLSKEERIGNAASKAIEDAPRDALHKQTELSKDENKTYTLAECGHEDEFEGSSASKTAASLLDRYKEPVEDSTLLPKGVSTVSRASRVIVSPQEQDKHELPEKSQIPKESENAIPLLSDVVVESPERQFSATPSTNLNRISSLRALAADTVSSPPEERSSEPLSSPTEYGQNPVGTPPPTLQIENSQKPASIGVILAAPMLDEAAYWPQGRLSRSMQRSYTRSQTPIHAPLNELQNRTIASPLSIGSVPAVNTGDHSPKPLHEKSSDLAKLTLKHSESPDAATISLPVQVDVSSDSAHWEAGGRGRGIKRVQVIISLFETDDLVVEAKLQKKSKGRA
ncbi:hypothetical protein MMC28_005434 [Mycoblastus sanguinarius]|nr:hypothetical protein [Mycoblastus sanguinarius]